TASTSAAVLLPGDSNLLQVVAPGPHSVTTLAGSVQGFADAPGSGARFGHLRSVAVDPGGIVLATDEGNSRIRWMTPQGNVHTLAGSDTAGLVDGPIAIARLS